MHRTKTTDYFLESIQTRSQRNHSVEVKETPRILYPKKICYNNKGKLNFFQENTISEFIASISTLQEISKEILCNTKRKLECTQRNQKYFLLIFKFI